MWLLVQRPPRADMPYWPGRRRLAALDALAWPLLWMALGAALPWDLGVLMPTLVCWLLWRAWCRLAVAVWSNHRYRCTTWRWGRLLFALTALGLALRIGLG